MLTVYILSTVKMLVHLEVTEFHLQVEDVQRGFRLFTVTGK
jgi:hypothetical protein